jgi:hypothetical protein
MVLRWTQTKILFLCGQWADNIRWVGGGLSSPPLVLHWARGSTRSMPKVQVGWHHYSPMGLQKQRNNGEKKRKENPLISKLKAAGKSQNFLTDLLHNEHQDKDHLHPVTRKQTPG